MTLPLAVHLNRRAALMALASLLAPGVDCQVAASRIGNDYPFPLGVASGMPRPDSIVLWTRLAAKPLEPGGGLPPAPIEVHWQVADDDAFSRGLRSGRILALPEHAHSVHVQVSGLRSATTFFYRFLCGDAASPIGRTRTAPADDAAVMRLRLALASCQHYEQGAFAAQRDIAGRDLDAVLFVGDYIYESSNPRTRVRRHEGPPPVTLDAYRARHATYKLDAELRAAHAAHPWILTWDDHEVENDYAGDRSPSGLDPPALLRRRTAAYKAYFEHLPVAPSMLPHGPSMRIHDSFGWGRLARIWTADNRQYRSVQACPDARGAGSRLLTGCESLSDPARSMFGTDQERWLAEGMSAGHTRWQLLAQASQISEAGVDTPGGRRINSDGWDGYPAARERLLAGLAAAAHPGVVCLGGDVHRHVAAQLRRRPNDAGSPVIASEFVCSSLTSHGISEASMARIRASNPDIVHARSDERGYALLDITPQRVTCDFLGMRTPVAADARPALQARFIVEHGRPGVRPA
jgi:alkaline phosphatase D